MLQSIWSELQLLERLNKTRRIQVAITLFLILSLLHQGLSQIFCNFTLIFIPGEKCSDPTDYVLPSLPSCPQNQFVDNNVNSMKLKLQLFPIDEPTRRALEVVSIEKTYKHLTVAMWNSFWKLLYIYIFFVPFRISIIHTWSLHLVLERRYPQFWNI